MEMNSIRPRYEESLRAIGESRMSLIGKYNGLGQHRIKVPSRGQPCSVQRTEEGADGTEKARDTNGQKVMTGRTWVVGDGMIRKSCDVNSGRSAGRSREASRSQSTHSSEETSEKRWSEGVQESEIWKGQ